MEPHKVLTSETSGSTWGQVSPKGAPSGACRAADRFGGEAEDRELSFATPVQQMHRTCKYLRMAVIAHLASYAK